MKKIIIFLIAFCFCSILVIKNTTAVPKAKSILNTIPQKDQKLLENFLRYLVCNERFGYALAGVKAAATSGYYGHVLVPGMPFVIMDPIKKDEIEAFRKYKKLFNSEYFIFRETPFKPEVTAISLICKKKFASVARRHRNLLHSIFDTPITPEELLQKVASENIDLFNILHQHDGMFGLFLGCDEENALLYQRRVDLRKCMNTTKAPFQFQLKPRCGFSSIQEEYNFLQSSGGGYVPIDRNVCMFEPVVFIDFGSAKASSWITKYEGAQEKIAKLFKDRSFLEVFLEHIHSEEST